jgi:hypothetical protein
MYFAMSIQPEKAKKKPQPVRQGWEQKIAIWFFVL